ncbi:MAG: PilT/PilU family type 4a pilus ATPase [Myxococcota bacterium]|jgi:twitching motility protein PilT|nr:PilT/PilU family type 4a pilus ATPase [Myxococcota bacterium]
MSDTSLITENWQSEQKVSLHKLLQIMIAQQASDLLITTGASPKVRVDGNLVSVKGAPLTPSETKRLCYSILTDAQKEIFEEQNELDLSFGVKNLARFRANLFVQRGSIAAAIRQVPYEIKSIEELGLPPIVKELSQLKNGLILVTGSTGSGKSTSIAAILDQINQERSGHIVTVEDPIEFIHNHKNCLVNQREVGSDTESFSQALKYVLRQNPNVVLIGEMRDLETMEAALQISETGHLTLATLHTNSASQTINRIIDAFPPHQQRQVRVQLSFVLQAVICQQLVPKLSSGRILAAEVMIASPAIRNLIREEKIHQIYSQIQLGQVQYGMQTLNHNLIHLVQQKIISVREAIKHSTEPGELQKHFSRTSS